MDKKEIERKIKEKMDNLPLGTKSALESMKHNIADLTIADLTPKRGFELLEELKKEGEDIRKELRELKEREKELLDAGDAVICKMHLILERVKEIKEIKEAINNEQQQ